MGLKKNLVEKPDNVKLPEHFIFKVRRDHQFFKNRSWKFYSGFGEDAKLVDVIKIPDNQIICDSCNLELKSAIINLVIYINPDGETFIESAICNEDMEKYYSKLPVINLIRCNTCAKKVESFSNKESEKEFLESGKCEYCQDHSKY